LLTAQATRLGESGYDRAACTEFPEGTRAIAESLTACK
jgi:hypothetical protein